MERKKICKYNKKKKIVTVDSKKKKKFKSVNCHFQVKCVQPLNTFHR